MKSALKSVLNATETPLCIAPLPTVVSVTQQQATTQATEETIEDSVVKVKKDQENTSLDTKNTPPSPQNTIHNKIKRERKQTYKLGPQLFKAKSVYYFSIEKEGNEGNQSFAQYDCVSHLERSYVVMAVSTETNRSYHLLLADLNSPKEKFIHPCVKDCKKQPEQLTEEQKGEFTKVFEEWKQEEEQNARSVRHRFVVQKFEPQATTKTTRKPKQKSTKQSVKQQVKKKQTRQTKRKRDNNQVTNPPKKIKRDTNDIIPFADLRTDHLHRQTTSNPNSELSFPWAISDGGTPMMFYNCQITFNMLKK